MRKSTQSTTVISKGKKGEKMFKSIKSIISAAAIIILVAGSAHAFTTGDTLTKYPIILVPGVMGFDQLAGNVPYFYDIAHQINVTAGKTIAYDADLNPWLNTYDRGVSLKNEILRKIRLHYKLANTVTNAQIMANRNYRVNIIAHSHGSTTSRVAASLIPKNVASIVTVAGPHYGTPMADASYTLNDNAFGLVLAPALLLCNVAGATVDILSGDWREIMQNNSGDVLNDFTQAGMKNFNESHAYASSGLWKGGSYGTGKYGSDYKQTGAYAGDGQGHAMSVSDSNAILYYCITGNIGDGWTTKPGWFGIGTWDPVDWALLGTHWLNNYGGFHGNADAFVPVSSARFGKVISLSYWWNHCDEQNQTLGMIDGGAADPVLVYKNHAVRLKAAGR